MTRLADDTGTKRLPVPLIELRTIWVGATRIFFRKFNYLSDEIAAATWRRFLITVITTLIVSSGLYHLALGLSYQGTLQKSFGLHFNLLGYWIVETLWAVVTASLIDIPFILLVAYLSYYWISHTKDEDAHWIQEAQALAITWVITAILVQGVYLLGGVVREALFRNMLFTTRLNLEHRYSPILNYLFSGLLTAPIVAYRYNLRLHGNKILNGLTGRDRWLLLAFQFVMLEGGTLLVGRFLLNLPFIADLHQILGKLWVGF
jgi:hypothetical protein